MGASYVATISEILEENSVRYASTSISGGVSNAIGHIERIRSTTDHHQAQTVWVRDLASGRERCLTFTDPIGIQGRPGHRISVVENERGEIVRVRNHSTGASFSVGSRWDDRRSELKFKIRLLLSTFLAAGLSFPLLNLLVAPVFFLQIARGEGFLVGKNLWRVPHWFLLPVVVAVGWTMQMITLEKNGSGSAMVVWCLLIDAGVLLHLHNEVRLIQGECRKIEAAIAGVSTSA